MSDHHWITFLRVVFPAIIAASERRFPRHPGADIWRFRLTQRLTAEGGPSFASDVWCGMAAFDNEATARTFHEDPAASFPDLTGAEGVWTALALPVAHRGTVNWRGTPETDSALRIAREVPGGVLAVVTRAGFEPDTRISLSRRKAFAAGIDSVRAFYAGLDGNLYRDVGNGAGLDGMDGITLSLWSEDSAMMAGAYRPDIHRSQMESHAQDPMFDRSSFSRFRVLDTRGDWGRPAAA